ncbi:MAG: SDR family NAD(P)-dependent oxidoreductase [Nocardioides sp.]
MDISGTAALVTGAASGIGAAAARPGRRGRPRRRRGRAGREGAALAAELGGEFAAVDVTDTAQIRAAVDRAAALGPLRVLVNSAGIGWAQRTIGRDGEYASAHDLAAFQRVIAINLVGSFDAIRLASTAMSRLDPLSTGERGSIVNIASIAAFDGQIGQAAYAASKGGLVGLTLPVARDLAAAGIRLNTVAPGLVDTPIYDFADDPEALKAQLGRACRSRSGWATRQRSPRWCWSASPTRT